jgi:hypothetical protein
MKKVNKNEVAWQQIKLINGGAKGLQLKFSYLENYKGHAIMNSISSKKDVPPTEPFRGQIHSLRPTVAKVMSIDYARELLHESGFEPTDMQQQFIEAAVQKAMRTIEVTGISLSERKQGKGAIISYLKTDEQGQTTGHSTPWICYTGEFVYGIEDDLEESVEQIVSDAYDYQFDDIYLDFEQLAISYPDEEISEDPEVEEADLEEVPFGDVEDANVVESDED